MKPATQPAYPSDGTYSIAVTLPGPETEVIAGVCWGEAGGLFTPAYWAAHCALEAARTQQAKPHRLGQSLREEMSACLLGGYGMPAELGLAAFAYLRDRGLLYPGVTAAELEEALSQPLQVGNRTKKYRYPRQRSVFLAGSLAKLEAVSPPQDARALRQYFCQFPGIGPKTASWIVRNWLDSDEVAILDVHIIRALSFLGLINEVALPRDYQHTERIFVEFSQAIGVRASVLDALMWQHMRQWGFLIDPLPGRVIQGANPKRPRAGRLRPAPNPSRD